MRHTPVLVLAASCALAGCANIPRSYDLLKEPPVAGGSSITIADARPPVEKVMNVDESPDLLMIKYGDADFSMDRMEILSRRLKRELGSIDKDVKVEVTRFSSVVSRMSIGTPGGKPVRPTTYVLTKPDGTIPASYAGASAVGNVIGVALVNSDWFRSLPSMHATVSVLIQGTVNGVGFLGNDSAFVKAGSLGDAMPKAIDTAINNAVRDIKRRASTADAQR